MVLLCFENGPWGRKGLAEPLDVKYLLIYNYSYFVNDSHSNIIASQVNVPITEQAKKMSPSGLVMDLKRAARTVVPQSLIETGATAVFLAKRNLSDSAGADVPDLPHFDAESTKYFIEKMDQCAFYMEYGTGGSTVLAAREGKAFIAVDSDAMFMSSVQNKIGKLGSDQRLINVDIGVTGLWGVPIFKKATKSRVTKWRRYPAAPWAWISEQRLPDLILVDGRFRVACALTCIKNMQHQPGWTLLIDDYVERPHYRIVERFAKLKAMAGRMAVFGVTPFKADDLDRELENHYSDWR